MVHAATWASPKNMRVSEARHKEHMLHKAKLLHGAWEKSRQTEGGCWRDGSISGMRSLLHVMLYAFTKTLLTQWVLFIITKLQSNKIHLKKSQWWDKKRFQHTFKDLLPYSTEKVAVIQTIKPPDLNRKCDEQWTSKQPESMKRRDFHGHLDTDSSPSWKSMQMWVQWLQTFR
jgi:hypothetical protein